MTVARGDVVLVHFPFTAGTGSKVRPALVVQNDRDNRRLTNTIIAQITTNTSRVGESTQILIDPTTAEGRSTGLLSPSVVNCLNIATIDGSRVIRTVGKLPATLMRQIDDCLRAALGLRDLSERT